MFDLPAANRLPKAEIHVHLEGCFEVEQLVGLAAEAGVALPRRADLLFAFHGFDEFLEFLTWSCGLVRTPEHVARAAYRYAERAAQAGIRYADVIVNPCHWPTWKGALRGLVDALDAGWREAEHDGLAKVGLCLSILRQQSAAEAIELVDAMIDLDHPRVVALSIDGNEQLAGRTGPRFAEAFRRAGAAGFGRTVHAGESSGPEGVRDAIDLLGADRIDHGVRAIHDADLVRELADRQIALDICPSSNVVLGIVPDLASHPIDALRRAGVPVSVNTDDPAFLGVRLDHDYVKVADAFDWDRETVRSIARTSIEHSFADPDTKSSILQELAVW